MTKKKVDNDSTKQNPVGRFMVAVGALITNQNGEILLCKRNIKLDWRPGEWEIMYGRIAQHEDPQDGLSREVKEELGIEITIGKPLRVWHVYRGHDKTAYNDLIGITFLVKTISATVKLSNEHEDYRWVTPAEALNLVKVEGIRQDLKAYLNLVGNNISSKTIKLGKYKHFKGKFYEVLGVAKHSETLEDYVYYRCLHPNSLSKTWVRPLSIFEGDVTLPNGQTVPRFQFVAEI